MLIRLNQKVLDPGRETLFRLYLNNGRKLSLATAMYKLFIRPFLFLIDPEKVHHLVFRLIKITFFIPGVSFLARMIFTVKNEKLIVSKMGLRFANPIGLAAGFDKDAVLYKQLAAFGFGFIEIGTLTPKPQPGNDKPRMFRLPQSQGLINRMGFNNKGVDAAAKRLKKRKKSIIIGGNIGKNKSTSNDEALNDYIYCFNALFEVVDYFVINVSSPNTPGLRELQERGPLLNLLQTIQQLNAAKPKPKPVLLKVAPDLSYTQIDEIIEVVRQTNLAGIVATNTTLSREGIDINEKFAAETGGLSGKSLTDHSTEIIRYIRMKAGKELVIIGVGGIFTAQDARDKIRAGADLVQVYTGFIYEGPAMAGNISKELIKTAAGGYYTCLSCLKI